MNDATQFSADRLKQLIIQNELTQVLEELLCVTKGKFGGIYNEIVLHFSNYNELRQDSRLGLLNYEQLTLAKNQLKFKLLQLIDDLDKSLLAGTNLLSNKEVFTLIFDDKFENYNYEMEVNILDSLSKYWNIDKTQLTIKDAYQGSIKIIIEAESEHVRALMEKFKNNPDEVKKLFGDRVLKDIVTTDALYEQIALTFYNLLINQSPDFEAALYIYHEIEKQNIKPNVDTFINLIAHAPDFQTATFWKNNMMEEGVKANELFYGMMQAKQEETVSRPFVFHTVVKRQLHSSHRDILNLCYEAIAKSLAKRDMYSPDLCKELSAQLVFNILNRLEINPINELPNYIRVCAKNLVIGHSSKSKRNREIPTDPLGLGTFEKVDSFAAFDVLIKDEYDNFDEHQLKVIRTELGDKDYLMLEAHFKDNESYKTIADKMGIAVHIVANHINRARAKCQKLKEFGKIAY
jgi:DNA-directed RNA polymerase specialized sigma24 family protein